MEAVMNYGLPYKGSKNSIAKSIIDALPAGDNFCDCCCGGGAILQAAVLSGKYKTVTGFDINKAIVGLVEATMVAFNQIDYESVRLVTKEEFYARRDRNETLLDWLSRYIASFGFNGMEYMWGEHRLKHKYLMQRAISAGSVEERRIALRDFMVSITKDRPSDEDFKNLCHLEQATNLQRFRDVERIMKERKTKTKLSVVCGSMYDIPFEKYDVIYFDPPYGGTKGYQNKQFSFIVFKALLSALKESGKQVFVSEYNQPCEGYTEVWSATKRMTQDAYRNAAVTEKLFYGGSKEDYEKLSGIGSLDDSGDNTPVHVDTDGGTEPTVSPTGQSEEGEPRPEVNLEKSGE